MKLFKLIIVLSLFSYQVHAQWESVENLEGGGWITDIIKFKDKIYFSTIRNGIFYSNDNGKSWQKSIPELNNRISAFTIHKDQLVAVGYNQINYSSDGINWYKKPTTNELKTDITSDGENLYFATLLKGLYSSKDNGNNWIRIFDTNNKYGIHTIATQDQYIFLGSDKGIIFKSDDHGNSWDTIQVDTGYNIEEIYIEEGHVYVNAVESIIKSSVETINWQVISTTNRINSFYMEGPNSSYSYNGYIYISNDYGSSWSSVEDKSNPFGHSVSATFFDGNEVIVGTIGQGIFRKEADFTQAWQNEKSGINLVSPNNYLFHQENIYIATDYNFVMSSNDEGENWQLETNQHGISTGRIQHLTALDEYIFSGSGGGGIESKHLDDTEWKSMDDGISSDLIAALGANQKYVYACTDNSSLYRSADLGLNWQKINVDNERVARTLFARDSLIILGTWDGVFLSKDNGNTWQDISNNLTDKSINDIEMIDSTLVIATQKNGIYLSKDFGNHWEFVYKQNMYQLARYKDYLFSGRNGSVILSENKGETWSNYDNGVLPSGTIKSIGFTKKHIMVGIEDNGLWRRELHELVPPTFENIAKTSGRKMRKGDSVHIQYDMEVYNQAKDKMNNQNLDRFLEVKDSQQINVNFKSKLNETAKSIALFIEEPVVNESYFVNLLYAENESGLAIENETLEIVFSPNNLPLLDDIALQIDNESKLALPASLFKNSFKDEDDDEIQSIVFTSLPAHGQLMMQDDEVLIDTPYDFTKLAELNYLPKEDFEGEDQVSWNAFDGYDLAEIDGKIIISVSEITLVDESVDKLANSRFYPNPFKEYIQVKFERNWYGVINISLYDLFGKNHLSTIVNKESKSHIERLDAADLPKGLYILEIIHNNETEVVRLIKE